MSEASSYSLPVEPPAAAEPPSRRSFSGVRLSRVAVGVTLLLVTVALVVPWLPLADPVAPDYQSVLQPPSAQHWLGTDLHGRDQLARLLWASRASLAIGLAGTALALLTGVAVGGAAGAGCRWADAVLMRIGDVFLSFPIILGGIALVSILGPGRRGVLIAIALFGWPVFARVFRSSLLSVKQQPFIKAGRLLGLSPLRTFGCHLLPNAVAPLLSYAALSVAGALIAEAGLSYVNLGVQRPAPSWGLMLADSMGQFATAPWLLAGPAAAIGLTTLTFILLGAALSGSVVGRGKPLGRA